MRGAYLCSADGSCSRHLLSPLPNYPLPPLLPYPTCPFTPFFPLYACLFILWVPFFLLQGIMLAFSGPSRCLCLPGALLTRLRHRGAVGAVAYIFRRDGTFGHVSAGSSSSTAALLPGVVVAGQGLVAVATRYELPVQGLPGHAFCVCTGAFGLLFVAAARVGRPACCLLPPACAFYAARADAAGWLT